MILPPPQLVRIKQVEDRKNRSVECSRHKAFGRSHEQDTLEFSAEPSGGTNGPALRVVPSTLGSL